MSSKSSNTPFFEIGRVVEIPLHEATRSRFLNYAVSVITARALPDVRDGLKPVQRRILYTMFHDLHLSPEKSTIKCAKIVGQVLGNYHPHGDSAVYEAMARMAQPWTLRYPLVMGQGNFGSIDGDGPAAYRYTEAKLLPIAMEFVQELPEDTVDFVPTFDESQLEPVVLPTSIPQLLVNGCTGIAVGIATNIPPHNLGEMLTCCEALVDNRDLPISELTKIVKGPDFPTGGEILESQDQITKVYAEGQGRIRVRGTYRVEEDSRKGPKIIIDSIPYMLNKSSLLEEIGELVMTGKLPFVNDVRDESTEDIRIVLECGKNADPAMIMAYLYKNSHLQVPFYVNMTCLTPRGPEKVSLRTALLDFVDFRYEVVVRRLSHEVALLKERIHILEGLTAIFDALDEAIEIIRTSDGRKFAFQALQQRFNLDDVQTNAVLDLRLYRLGKPDILAVRDELAEKLKAKGELEDLLGSVPKLWNLVKSEFVQLRKRFGDPRRSLVLDRGLEEQVYTEEDFIVSEDVQVLFSKDGWLRRVSGGTDVSKVRMRPDDALNYQLNASTLHSAAFFTNTGSCYTMRVNDVPVSSRGYGEPIQKYFNFTDGERVVNMMIFDPANMDDYTSIDDSLPKIQGLAAATDGRGLRFSLAPFAEISTKNGRKYARTAEDVSICAMEAVKGDEWLIVLSQQARVIIFAVDEISFLNGPGRGVILLKLDINDKVMEVMAVNNKHAGMTLMREGGGKTIEVTPRRYRVVSRGGKGTILMKRFRLKVVGKHYEPTEESMKDLPKEYEQESLLPATDLLRRLSSTLDSQNETTPKDNQNQNQNQIVKTESENEITNNNENDNVEKTTEITEITDLDNAQSKATAKQTDLALELDLDSESEPGSVNDNE